MIPGLGAQMRQAKAQISDDDYKHIEAIIYSMTPEERRNPEVIGKRRTARIAKGSGRTPQEVKALLKQFGEMQKMMGQLGKMAKKGKMPPGLGGMGGGGGFRGCRCGSCPTSPPHVPGQLVAHPVA
jgi:signal recognition particle subunit SRP54